MKSLNLRSIKRLLIRSTNWIGDAVMTTPAVRAIRKNFPDAKISLLTKPWVAPVFSDSPYVDNLLIYDEAEKHKGLSGKLRLARELKQYGFDAAILLQNAFEAALITFFAGIPCRIGYNTDVRGFLLTHSVFCTPQIKKMHQTGYYLGILQGIGLKADGLGLDLVVNKKYQKRAVEILEEHGISRTNRLVGINPSATFGPAKQWFPERYAALSDKIHEVFGADILLFGGPGDRELGRKISKMMKYPPVDLSGKTDLGEAIALINMCNLFITNDSGLMHVAAAFDIPLIAIFGSTNPVTTGPKGLNSRIVRIPVECSPCLKPKCPKGHLECMNEIDVDMVFDMAKELL
ncbi:MAG: lipopolysaccharide heptosyltransferase II [Desulfobacterales bacterium]|uniref:lipopolysaccharide heptosyltransferase II n=1 Tax=Candidatus Desulfaltia bathyphila TaxID=2841697 RepID=A0A8J6N5B1_9BACT|nr:lipopolysaccharide heptosyltransferase II [Candidatus Desulfaltia bathyphila]MBL7196098.1 lipopolysaccharide heptosyltransferase II [Desulfobacterales bacterium]MBL7207595.1 lipopolysaccharide heptosyltransferase II [Desulfobacterales bacterium]